MCDKWDLINPCRICVVRMMCNKPCEELVEVLRMNVLDENMRAGNYTNLAYLIRLEIAEIFYDENKGAYIWRV